MLTSTRPLTALTASDLMSRDVVQVSQGMPLRVAAQLLLQHEIGGAPVVDAQGTCVGVFSTTDLLRWLHKENGGRHKEGLQRALSCFFQLKYREPGGEERVLCTLPAGVCPVQRREQCADAQRIFCSQPHGVLSDWQVVTVEELPTEEVRHFMTPDPVMVTPDTPIADLARWMVDAHIHRVIVVDAQRRPIGIVSSTDILASVAHAGYDPLAEAGSLI
jgi:CBS-domain-containing membrane protein